MTLVSLLVAGTAVPALTHHRVQLAFTDNFGLDGNRFAGVWDRLGAIPPRRTAHEPFDDGTCRASASTCPHMWHFFVLCSRSRQ